MAINFRGVPQSKRRLIYKILTIYRDCGYLEVYKSAGDHGRLLKHNEFDLFAHLERLEQGKPEWMFSYANGENKIKPKIKEEIVKRIRQLTLFVMLFISSGCMANPPWLQQMRYENDVLSHNSYEDAMAILAPLYTLPDGTVIFPDTRGFPSPGPVNTFTNGFLYKNSTYLNSTFGTRKGGRR